MGREYELKFRATPAQQADIRSAFGPFHTITMETTYFDTPSRSLSARKWTLRRRLENGVSICTLKTPADGGARGEWEVECGDILAAVLKLCKLGAPEALVSLTADGLVEVCGARFTRQAGLQEVNGTTVELALDQGVLLGGGREMPLCEVEVELKQGEELQAYAFAMMLSGAFGLKTEEQSKYRRALALAGY